MIQAVQQQAEFECKYNFRYEEGYENIEVHK